MCGKFLVLVGNNYALLLGKDTNQKVHTCTEIFIFLSCVHTISLSFGFLFRGSLICVLSLLKSLLPPFSSWLCQYKIIGPNIAVSFALSFPKFHSKPNNLYKCGSPKAERDLFKEPSPSFPKAAGLI